MFHLFVLLWIGIAGQVWSSEVLSPRDVHIDSVDSVLSWLPNPGQTNVMYTAEYRRSEGWKAIPGCVQTQLTSCNVTTVRATENSCMMLRVRAERLGEKSRPVEACSTKGDSCSPDFSLTARSRHLSVHLSQNHSLIESYAAEAQYQVFYQKEGEAGTERETLTSSSLVIEDVEEGVRYCVQVGFNLYMKPYGVLSCWKCERIPVTEFTKSTRIIIIGVVVISVLGLAVLTTYFLIFKKEKIEECMRPKYEMPKVLLRSFPQLPQPLPSRCPSEVFDLISVISQDEASSTPAPEAHSALQGIQI